MVYKIFNINDMNEDIASQYFPLLSEGKRAKILGAKDKYKAAVAFVADMLARQCLSEFCNAPEFSFSLLINPDSKSVVSNFNAEISVASSGEYVACAVSDVPVGISIVKAEPFTFSEAQNILTDSEIRFLFSFSKYSFTELISKEFCDEALLCERYSLLKSLKTAQFSASGRGIKERKNSVSFDFSGNSACCSDILYKVLVSEHIKISGLSVSIIEKRPTE